ncbi:hypothetical protein MHU86_22655 [Fragilaria crotonensis]|nr:hypothetical protein MHU86_22655 [Fragilaria crotonensis]
MSSSSPTAAALKLLKKSLLAQAKLGNLDKVRDLLRNATTTDPDDDDDNVVLGDTALSLASAHGHADVVSELLKHAKVDANETNNLGRTALMLACRNGHLSVVRKL